VHKNARGGDNVHLREVRAAAHENLIKRARAISADPLIKLSPRDKFWHRAFAFKHLHRLRRYHPIDAFPSARGRAAGGKRTGIPRFNVPFLTRVVSARLDPGAPTSRLVALFPL